jgi:hypothetical protein
MITNSARADPVALTSFTEHQPTGGDRQSEQFTDFVYDKKDVHEVGRPSGTSRAAALRHQHDNVVTLPVARIIPADGGGYLVITHKGHAWLHGSRQDALKEKAWLDAQWRGRS